MMVKKIPREDSLMLRSSSLLNETTGLWPDTTELWLEKHKITQNTKTKRERSSEAAIVGAILVGWWMCLCLPPLLELGKRGCLLESGGKLAPWESILPPSPSHPQTPPSSRSITLPLM
ncbi:hypothetical protein ATANTOWER_027819 [Ataeniobius toweri]|uniref:Uncharacterized protein n=1 Tax=Ataeniobius toweri TaxID=208326 RepID=A0ABU7BSE6_9TELE|nr:hypothetical protein [Ataeniobius toweri]